MTSIIASTNLLITHDGRERPVTAAIGLPYRGTSEWRCPVALDGLHDQLAHAGGEDALQALCLAAWLLRTLLEDVKARGGEIRHADGSEFSIEANFGRVGA